MKKKTMKRIVAGCLLVGLLSAVGIGAYLTDTEVKEDVYTVGNVQAEIVANGDMEVANAGYLLPGTVHTYKRAATNTGINDAYVFMSITIPYDVVGVSDENGAQLGNELRQLFIPGSADGGYISSEWKLVDEGYIGNFQIYEHTQSFGEHDKYFVGFEGDTITYVYGYVGDNADGTLKALASGETTSNLVDTMKLTNLSGIDRVSGEVTTKLYAIQSNYVNGGITDVNGVWAVINEALVAEHIKTLEEVDIEFYFPDLNADPSMCIFDAELVGRNFGETYYGNAHPHYDEENDVWLYSPLKVYINDPILDTYDAVLTVHANVMDDDYDNDFTVTYRTVIEITEDTDVNLQLDIYNSMLDMVITSPVIEIEDINRWAIAPTRYKVVINEDYDNAFYSDFNPVQPDGKIYIGTDLQNLEIGPYYNISVFAVKDYVDPETHEDVSAEVLCYSDYFEITPGYNGTVPVRLNFVQEYELPVEWKSNVSIRFEDINYWDVQPQGYRVVLGENEFIVPYDELPIYSIETALGYAYSPIEVYAFVENVNGRIEVPCYYGEVSGQDWFAENGMITITFEPVDQPAFPSESKFDKDAVYVSNVGIDNEDVGSITVDPDCYLALGSVSGLMVKGDEVKFQVTVRNANTVAAMVVADLQVEDKNGCFKVYIDTAETIIDAEGTYTFAVIVELIETPTEAVSCDFIFSLVGIDEAL